MNSDLETAVNTAKGNASGTLGAQGRVCDEVANVLNEHFRVSLSPLEAKVITHAFVSVQATRTTEENVEHPTKQATCQAVSPTENLPHSACSGNKTKGGKKHYRTCLPQGFLSSTLQVTAGLQSYLSKFKNACKQSLLRVWHSGETNIKKPQYCFHQPIMPFPLMELDRYDTLSIVLSYLPYEDLNSLAVCNKRLRQLRSHDSLDQTRSLTLDFSNGSGNALERLEAKIDAVGPNVFQANNISSIYLKGFIQNLDDECTNLDIRDWRPPSLPGVTRLCLKKQSEPENPFVKWKGSLELLHLFFPNLRHLDIGDNSCFEFAVYNVECFNRDLGCLTSLSCGKSQVRVLYDGYLRAWDGLRELYLDGVSDSSSTEGKGVLKHSLPPNLERLDIRGAKVGTRRRHC